MKAEMIRPGKTSSVLFDPALTDERLDALSLLRSEVDMLVDEDTQLMKITAAAALFVSQLRGSDLPDGALNAASTLAQLIGEVPDETMCDALDMLTESAPSRSKPALAATDRREVS